MIERNRSSADYKFSSATILGMDNNQEQNFDRRGFGNKIDELQSKVVENWLEKGGSTWTLVTGAMMEKAQKDEEFKEQLKKYSKEYNDKTYSDSVEKLRDIAADWVVREMSDEPQGGKYLQLEGEFGRMLDVRSFETKLDEIANTLDALTPRKKLALAVLFAAMVISACTPVNAGTPRAETPTGVVPSPTAVEIFTPTTEPTKEALPTKAPTSAPTMTNTEVPKATVEVEAAEPKLIEMDKVELNIGGRKVDFVIGREENSDILEYWKPWGIKALGVNKNLDKYPEKMSALVGTSLWQAYVAQGGKEVSYDEFVKNPDKYPITVTRPGKSIGEYDSKTFNLGDVKKVEYRYVNSNDPRLYMDDSSILGTKFGYKLRNDGTLIVYTCWGGNEKQLSTYQKFIPVNLLATQNGNEIGKIHHQLIGIAFTSQIASSGGYSPAKGTFFSAISNTEKAVGYPSYEGCVAYNGCKTAADGGAYFAKFSYFVSK